MRKNSSCKPRSTISGISWRVKCSARLGFGNDFAGGITKYNFEKGPDSKLGVGFSCKRCHFFAHLRPNKPKSLFCPIQERRKPSERGKNGMKVRFSRIFLQIGWSKRPQDIVFHFHHCVKHLPSRIPKKTSCRSHSWALMPLFSKIVQRFCKNVCK